MAPGGVGLYTSRGDGWTWTGPKPQRACLLRTNRGRMIPTQAWYPLSWLICCRPTSRSIANGISSIGSTGSFRAACPSVRGLMGISITTPDRALGLALMDLIPTNAKFELGETYTFICATQ